MNWFAWRQHRKQFLVMGIILALYAALIIPTGLHFWHVYQQTLASCKQNPATPSCSDLPGNLLQTTTDQFLFHIVPIVVLFLPVILGMFWGVPLLAREYAEGTNGLAWTQSVSRRKWLTVKLVWMLVATALFVGAFTALNTWWSRTPNALDMNRFNDDTFFRTQNIVPVAYGLFFVATGTMFGAWFKKTMVAVGVTIGVFIFVTNVIVPNLLRPHYMTPITITAPMTKVIGSEIPVASWVVSQNIVDKNGKAANNFNLSNWPPQCQKLTQDIQVPNDSHFAKIKAEGGDPVNDCLNQYGYHQIAKYQPAYRYWDFQRIEAGIYLVMTGLAIGATYWLVLKRDA